MEPSGPRLDPETPDSFDLPGASSISGTARIRRFVVIGGLFFVVFLAGALIVKVYLDHKKAVELQAQQQAAQVKAQEEKQYNDVYHSVTTNNPAPLQNTFVQAVKTGQMDKYAKSAGYFVFHRYFDNGGNIYELYDYAHSDPALSFLNDAEAIYPSIFADIKAKKLPKTYSEKGTYAYLAYLEAVDKKGYGDVALEGTAANQYAKMAYVGKSESKDTDVTHLSDDQKRNLDKAIAFAKNASTEVDAIVKTQTIPDDVYALDVVIGLNQYAYASRYFTYFKLPFTPSRSPEEVFALTADLTDTKYSLLRYFSHLMNASSLALVHGDPKQITAALQPIIDYDPSVTQTAYHSVVQRILNARTGAEADGVYSKANIVSIARQSPEFKDWLLRWGWKATDFN